MCMTTWEESWQTGETERTTWEPDMFTTSETGWPPLKARSSGRSCTIRTEPEHPATKLLFRLFECCALSFFERFVLSFSLKIERFVSDSAEILICGLYIYKYVFNDGLIFFFEGSLMQFDIDTYIPQDSVHKKIYSIYYGEEHGKFWKKYIYGNVRLYYFNRVYIE